MSFASFKDFDSSYLEEFSFPDIGLFTAYNPDLMPRGNMSNHVNQDESIDGPESQDQDQTGGKYYIRLLTRLFRFGTRPSHGVDANNNLQRISSNSSAASYCSQRLHQVLRDEQSMIAFPTFRRNPTFFQRKSPPQGRYRSLKGKTLGAVRRFSSQR